MRVREDGTRRQGCDESSGWIWFAARKLDEYLAKNYIISEELEHPSILELGSGTGWLALQLAQRGAHVTATDRPGALPLLIQNVVSNQDSLDSIEGEIEVFCLAWEDSETRIPGTWSLFIGSDILYLSETYQALLDTLLRHDCRRCILAWEERKPEEEQQFPLMAKACGFLVDELSVVGTNPATQNIVWIISLTLKQTNDMISAVTNQ